MTRPPLDRVLLIVAVVLALAGAAFGRGTAHHAAAPTRTHAPATLTPFALARVLAEAPPDVVVIGLDNAEHALRGAQPAAIFGRDDAALIANAPQRGRIVLAARDVVRADRVARRLIAAGRSVSVIDGGIEAWDRAMRADPPAPPPAASAATRANYAYDLALRHAFGDPNAAPASAPRPVAPPPAAVGGGGGGGRREGC